jgi:hypothetical protein
VTPPCSWTFLSSLHNNAARQQGRRHWDFKENAMTERADFRRFYRDAHAVSCLTEREKVFMGLAVALARNCQY